MEKSREQCTVVFALIVTKSAIEFMCLEGVRRVAIPPPLQKYGSVLFSRFLHGSELFNKNEYRRPHSFAVVGLVPPPHPPIQRKKDKEEEGREVTIIGVLVNRDKGWSQIQFFSN
jgi:hypothetical protein